ncbi:MAG: hypothetical protein HF976_03705 [ANME-2 cluster archaeon]|nr:hypothetical protein [ANME-2 cluster archaeon]MBC2706546.1 hypothetical protein [ANME-2 cluster archaeon]
MAGVGGTICISIAIYFYSRRRLTNKTSTPHPQTAGTHVSARHRKAPDSPHTTREVEQIRTGTRAE